MLLQMNWKAKINLPREKGNNMHDLKIEKVISKSAKEVFKSLQEGKLFMNCSADSNSIEIDFRVGGKYKLDFKNHKVSNWGEFLEIIPDQKIVFSWCQTFGPDQKPDTRVSIELFADGPKTKLVLEHKGFKDKESCDNHYQGWNGGLTDLTSEMEMGQIRLCRRYDTSVDKLTALVKQSKDFQDVNVTLQFLEREGNASALEIIQSNLHSDNDKQVSRNKWDSITSKLMEII